MLKQGSLIKFKKAVWLTILLEDGSDPDIFVDDANGMHAVVLHHELAKSKLLIFIDGMLGIYRGGLNSDKLFYEIIYEA